MKKLIPTILIFTFVLLVSPSQTYAAWWNPISWFSNDIRIDEQEQPQNATSSDATSKTQTVNQDAGAVEKQIVISPVNNSQSSDTKTVEDLKAEVATLKASLDKLYTAHNALLEYTKTIASSGKSVGTATNNSVLEARVTELERKTGPQNNTFNTSADLEKRVSSLESTLDIVCRSTFRYCPSFGVTGSSLQARIEKLESGY